MLSEIQKNRLMLRAKEVVQNLLNELKIAKLDDNNICDLQSALDLKVATLVSEREDGESIDNELLEIYDLLVDIVIDNEDDLEFLNQLFLDKA